MNKLEDVISLAKISDFLQKKDADNEREEKKRTAIIVIGVIAGLVVIAGIVYAVYKYLTADDYDDFEDDFEDDFDDDFDDDFEDEVSSEEHTQDTEDEE